MSYDRDSEREEMRRSRRQTARGAQSSRRRPGRIGFIGIFAAVAVFGVITNFVSLTPSSPDRACTVTEKGQAMAADGNSMEQRVYTDCGVFVVGDAFFLGHFTSADTYGSLAVGSTYWLETIGPRFPFLSMFPNIIGVTAASPVLPAESAS